jgi:hypothetical protein
VEQNHGAGAGNREADREHDSHASLRVDRHLMRAG